MEYPSNSARISRSAVIAFALSLVLLVISFLGGIEELVVRWSQQEEYSHGFFIPMISLWLLWKRRDVLVASIGAPSLLGLPLILVAIFLLFVGELSAIFILIQIGFILGLAALVVLFGGYTLLRVSMLPLVFLVFAIPMPYFINSQLSWGLQLISSTLGVDMLRLLGISVYLQGNMIDLGSYKLQVVEACSGLRYLYPFLSLGFLAAYFFAAPIWQRVVVFLSTIPITIFMNSFRISVIGALVNFWGTGMAEGFLHFFEGWVIFMVCALLLLMEVYLLDYIFGQKRQFGGLLALPEVMPVCQAGEWRQGALLLYISIAILAVVAVTVRSLDHRQEILASREHFSSFPLVLGDWTAREDHLQGEIEELLGVDDYFLADYRNHSDDKVNLYVAYYASQRKGFSPHSPRVCMPGGGWRITDLTRIPYAPAGQAPFPINRAVLELNMQRQLVYYWFEQRGRRIANEYWMKWYLLIDSIIMNRTDGALVRVITPIHDGESITEADQRLQDFIAKVLPALPRYVPEWTTD